MDGLKRVVSQNSEPSTSSGKVSLDPDCVIIVRMIIMGGWSLHHILPVCAMLFQCTKAACGFSLGVGGDANSMCIEKEREALVKFKQGPVDDYGHLSSWGNEDVKKDCRKWRGIKCSNQTGHVIMLDLQVTSVSYFLAFEPLRGEIHPSLLELQHLNYLDLSNNDFGGGHNPIFIGHLTKLRYLNLSCANFTGTIPYQLGNLTSLHYLNLGWNNGFLNVENLEWLFHFSSLRHLDMSHVNLGKAIDWFQAIHMLPSLSELHLSGCQLSDVVPPLSFSNSSTSTLAFIDLSRNFLSSSILHWLSNFSGSLLDVDLSDNHLQGSIPDVFQNMKSLTHLSLSFNQLEWSIPKSFRNVCTLQILDLSSNNFTEELPKFVQNLPGCIENSLESLDLSLNQFSGSLPDNKIFIIERIISSSKSFDRVF
ncbi:hypothetical protein L1049_013690 [Liquidambar formosana]|uniref:Leucine-rich repeat-containing N-terminal plant-type domain-containing protein n=1 Tax=Liquidambar formosana TaxID=63359 RepID=A0AAP0RQL1_LIQFO